VCVAGLKKHTNIYVYCIISYNISHVQLSVISDISLRFTYNIVIIYMYALIASKVFAVSYQFSWLMIISLSYLFIQYCFVVVKGNLHNIICLFVVVVVALFFFIILFVEVLAKKSLKNVYAFFALSIC